MLNYLVLIYAAIMFTRMKTMLCILCAGFESNGAKTLMLTFHTWGQVIDRSINIIFLMAYRKGFISHKDQVFRVHLQPPLEEFVVIISLVLFLMFKHQHMLEFFQFISLNQGHETHSSQRLYNSQSPNTF